jgi:two-component system, response regulator
LAGSEPIEILLVEDNPGDAELTLHALEKSKLANRITLVRDGAEALDFLFCRGEFSNRRFEQAPHIVLLDLKLPKVDGLQVLREIKQDPRTRAIPVIVLTTSKEERDMVTSYEYGVNSYIQKPVSFCDFQEVVRQLGMYWLLVNSKAPAAAFSAAVFPMNK